MFKVLFIALASSFSMSVAAEMLPFDKFRLLREGMNEAQVLLLAGPPDRESTVALYYSFERVWYYIPARGQHDPWITTIRFNPAGKIMQIERLKP